MATIHTRRGKEGSATAFCTVEPIKLLISAIGTNENRAIAMLAYWSAARINAVLHLKDTDLKNDHVRYRIESAKTKRFHSVRKTRSLELFLSGFKLKRGYLFPANRKGQAIKPTAIYKTVKDDRGKQKRVKIGEYIRQVKTEKSFDTALNRAVLKIMTDKDGSYSRAIADMPEIADRGVSAFYGVSSHTFRRSMAMHLFYTLDWDEDRCMTVTGHESLDQFYTYIKRSNLDVDSMMAVL